MYGTEPISRVIGAMLLIAATMPFPVHAQAVSGIIAGMVKDPSGAVIPGVTVEAASPALIERVRDTVTDTRGEYKLIDLRPGTTRSPSRCQDSTR